MCVSLSSVQWMSSTYILYHVCDTVTSAPGHVRCSAGIGWLTRGLRVGVFCVRVLPDNARPCRFVRDSAYFASESGRRDRNWNDSNDRFEPAEICGIGDEQR